MSDKYVLDEAGEPVPCDDLFAWARWYETADRRVARTEIADPEHPQTPIGVRTDFLALDQGFGWSWEFPDDPQAKTPVLWETLIICDQAREEWLRDHLSECDGLWGVMQRYTSREDALAGHERMVQAVRAALVQAGVTAGESEASQ